MRGRKALWFLTLLSVIGLLGVRAQTTTPHDPGNAYPGPRFPSYLKVPRSVEDLMPQARKLASTKGGEKVGMGKLKAGETVLIVPDTTAEDLPLEAVRRALVERDVKVIVITEAEMVGLNRPQAEAVRKAEAIPSAQKGYLEIRDYWIEDFPRVFAHPEVARDWLKTRRPDLYGALYPKEQQMSAEVRADADKLTMENIGAVIREYLKKHPEVKGVYWGKRGGGFYARYLAPYNLKFMGFTTFTNSWELASQIGTFPTDVIHLIEKKTMDLISTDIDKVHVTDPEGTDVSWDVTPEMAERWMKGMYSPAHLLMYPDTATGAYGASFENYPAPLEGWIPREPIALINGVIAGTNGSGGFWPRMEMHFKNGYLAEIKGGGTYGDILREFLHYPHINDVTYPYYNHPGYWHLWELALGTNPKNFRNPSDFYGGGHAGIYCLTIERYRTGVMHWGFGNELKNEPGSSGLPAKWLKFGEEHNLPTGHDFHIHNYFATYKVHLKTTGKWVTLVDKGHLTVLNDPEVRALASRYGEADTILSEDWIPEVPGINAPGRYEDYAQDPWKYANSQMEKILNGSYEHFYQPAAR